MLTLLGYLILCYTSCVNEQVEDNSIISVRVRYGSGIFMKNENPEASKLNYYVVMDKKVDDFSFSSSRIIQTLITSLKDSSPCEAYVETDMEHVELVSFTFRRSNGTETSVYVFYDYISESEYVLFEGDLFLLQTEDFTEQYLEPYFLNKYGDQGENRFCNNENHTFRYFQHWKDDRGDYRESYEFTDLDDSIEIRDGEDAISRALAVSGMNPTDICWYYDAVTDYWMVRMFDQNNPHIGERHVPYVCDVILDSQGIVVECYVTQLTYDMQMP